VFRGLLDQTFVSDTNICTIPWQIHCIGFAPHAPEQNPIEDIWLQAKTLLRQRYYRCETFAQVKQMVVKFLQDTVFDFPKLYRYG
jgi:transposase